MKNWTRIFLVCFILVGGTVFWAHQLLNQFNNALNNLSASSFAIVNIPQTPFSNKTNKEQSSTSTQEIVSTSATSTDLKFSFVFPPKNSEVYIGCAHKLSFQSSTTIHLLEIALVNADTIETLKPTASGLARENKIEPNSQSLDWKVGAVLPGKYYIMASNINGVDAESYSKVFTISKMPKSASANERKKICKESGSSF
jgi:hypothetical protein